MLMRITQRIRNPDDKRQKHTWMNEDGEKVVENVGDGENSEDKEP